MTPPRPADFAASDCPAWAFDDSLTIPAAAARPAPPAPAGPRATPARPEVSPTLFTKEC